MKQLICLFFGHKPPERGPYCLRCGRRCDVSRQCDEVGES